MSAAGIVVIMKIPINMTQDEKAFVLRDLCARLPYGVKIDNMCNPSTLNSISNQDYIIVGSEGDKNSGFDLQNLDVLNIEEAKPYLFPISSMTEEQKKDCPIDETNLNIMTSNIGYGIIEMPWRLSYLFVDWCNKNHFDYRGLIPMGLAIDASGKNIY